MQPQPARFSPASEISSRTATQGYAQIPNSVIECQLLLTPAELAFVLIVCRRGENTVSDKHWTEWTGREARIKDSAIRGLKEKGLHVRGRGNAAKYHFDRNHWDSWVRTQPRSKRARTIDRSKSVTPKAGPADPPGVPRTRMRPIVRGKAKRRNSNKLFIYNKS